MRATRELWSPAKRHWHCRARVLARDLSTKAARGLLRDVGASASSAVVFSSRPGRAWGDAMCHVWPRVDDFRPYRARLTMRNVPRSSSPNGPVRESAFFCNGGQLKWGEVTSQRVSKMVTKGVDKIQNNGKENVMSRRNHEFPLRHSAPSRCFSMQNFVRHKTLH